MLQPVMAVCILFAVHRPSSHTDPNILRMASIWIYADIFRHYKQHTTEIWHKLSLLLNATNTPGSSHFGEYTFFSLYTLDVTASKPHQVYQ